MTTYTKTCVYKSMITGIRRLGHNNTFLKKSKGL